MTICEAFYHQPTGSWSYVVADPVKRCAVSIDPVLDYDPVAGCVSTESASQIKDYLITEGFKLTWILETHAHADHLSAADWLKREFDAKTAIGEGITKVQTTFGRLLNMPDVNDGKPFDRLLASHDRFRVGHLQVQVLHTPGHTNDSVTYLIDDMAFIGDTLFAPDFGSARCDFPGGDAGRLYDSVQQLYALGDDRRLMLGHDYPPVGRLPRFETTVAEQRRDNIHLNEHITREAFIERREARDQELPPPKLIWPSIQVNIRAGQLPIPDPNGQRYLKIPLRGDL